MHLLAAEPGRISDGEDPIDLGQDPADILFLTSADSEIACLAQALDRNNRLVSVRAANLLRLRHPMSVDQWIQRTATHSRLIVVRLLGGQSYWEYGIDQLVALAQNIGSAPLLAFLPGDSEPDPTLTELSTLPPAALQALWRCWVEGGPDNAALFLDAAEHLLDRWTHSDGSVPDLPHAVPIPPAAPIGPLPDLKSTANAATHSDIAPRVAIVGYRALLTAGDTAPITALHGDLERRGAAVLALAVTSLKDPAAAALLQEHLSRFEPDIILNTTGFAVSAPGSHRDSPFTPFDCPVLQVILSGGSQETWESATNGLSARDIAMTVALPEVDGRVLARAVSFKAAGVWDSRLQTTLARHQPVPDRIAFTAELALAWSRLRHCHPAERRVALMLANYPNKDGRLGNGVGLDTPASVVRLFSQLAESGYDLGPDPLPEHGDALMAVVRQGVTNAPDAATSQGRTATIHMPLADYEIFLSQRVPAALRDAVTERWGSPTSDPFFLPDRLAFALPLTRFGNVILGVQPARGYNIDPVGSYHDPALPPPHGYLAVYGWIRHNFDAHAVIHMGKHGNLEWLPGKAVALSGQCYPDAVLGPLPHLYPFIVNDPGEGTQAKRRTQAVIVDHLTPPLTRAETYGVLKDLEALVDEYYDAAAVDPRRLSVLRDEILSLSHSAGLLTDLGITETKSLEEMDQDAALAALDTHLCELKELQIRDGLHVFGESPQGSLKSNLLCALARSPRGMEMKDRGLTQALARDLNLTILSEGGETAFDPLGPLEMGAPWTGPRPAELASTDLSSAPWRSVGDTIERLELLAQRLVGDGNASCPAEWTTTHSVLTDAIQLQLAPAVEACGTQEISGILQGLNGQFVQPGPSGAPTRGRPDVLPTGRNFYSVDTRTLPTPTAWTLGWKAATLLVRRHLQDHGDWPRSVVLTAWGTSNMRTGGDDIAQALALMGARPRWDDTSRRVTGFEILPASVLDRPRVDVTLRISGFFRDAFPGLVDLVDAAARAVATLEEADAVNPIAAAVRRDQRWLMEQGVNDMEARRHAAHRVFGAMPGAYGAGLQALIDEKGWETDRDLAEAYVAWGGWAYGAGTNTGSSENKDPARPEDQTTSAAGVQAAHGMFRHRLAHTQAIIQNQDNREHDLLDSDDYYQFEGGAAAAVRVLSGAAPTVYHGDTSNTENPRIRTLEEEIARVVRARVVNPKWIAGVMRHGYKGAFEMAATVDYLFAFAATARAVKDHQFDLVLDAYLGDETVRDFLGTSNPDALKDMVARLREAMERNLWQSRRNDVHTLLDLAERHANANLHNAPAQPADK